MEIKKFDSFVDREQYLMCHYLLQNATAVQRYLILEGYLQQKVVIAAAIMQNTPEPELKITQGTVARIDNGVWGYGGDRWAVYLDGSSEPFPSALVMPVNELQVG